MRTNPLLLQTLSLYTPIHEDGYCSMYGVGGKTSFFGPQLPQANNTRAVKLSLGEREKLVDICGSSWENTQYSCCSEEQMTQLRDNLAKAEALISSCPACRENFNQLFCHFSCSPNQSRFVDVVATRAATNGVEVVDEVDVYISDEYASPLFESCENIKFGLTNGYAMDLIGGGAKNYTDFLKFLGDKKPQIGGSPFQINFKYNLPNSNDNLQLFQIDAKVCNDSDPQFACACSDCPQVCPELEKLPSRKSCKISNISCTSFIILVSYFSLLLTYLIITTFLKFQNKKKNSSQWLTDDNDVEVEIEDEYVSGRGGGVEYQTDILEGRSNISLSSHTTLNLQSLRPRKTYIVNNYLEKCFYNIGYFCSKHSTYVLTVGIFSIMVLSSFVYYIRFETNPVNLWVSPTAKAYIEKQKFDESFKPFYRTQQIILSNSTGGSILQDYEAIEWWFEKEKQIRKLPANVMIDGVVEEVTYDDICFKPLEDTCVLESFTQYFDGEISKLPEKTWENQIVKCSKSPVECLPSFQQPLKSNLLFGGSKGEDVLSSRAIIVTLLNNNDNDVESDQVIRASAWENELEEFLLINVTAEAKQLGINLSFMTEVSLEKELNKSTNTDIRIVVISYIIMFAYASYALSMLQHGARQISFINASFITPFGKVSGNNILLKFLAKSRFGLGLVGIFIVLFSVFSSMGFWSFLGLKSTLIIAEVIPFLILAVGVDNIFLICNEFEHVDELTVTSSLSLHEKIGKTMANIGPSIVLSLLCQFLCFILGSFVDMPAVKNFSLYISVAIVFNTLLQITVFISVLSLDKMRIDSGRLDLLPFIKVEADSISLPIDSEDGELNLGLSQILSETNASGSGPFQLFMKTKYIPFIFKKEVRNFLIFAFLAVFGISLSLIPNMELGLDQRIALPSDSYMVNYFNDVYEYLDVGPPIYFVVEDLNVTSITNQKKLCGKFTTCEPYSLVNIVEQEYKRSNQSTISEPVSSWIDDFLMWLNPELIDCCRVKKKAPDLIFCDPYAPPRQCETCYENKEWSYRMDGFPEGPDFMTYFNEWIDAPSYPCPLGGKAPYANSVYVQNNTIKRHAFRTSHAPLRSQKDFINAYHNSLRIIDEIKENNREIDVYAYSPFYIYFVQYEDIKKLTFSLIGIGLLLVGFVSLFLLGSLRNSLVFILNLILIISSILGWMVFAGITLNAVSLVNLLICVGLSVEFAVHMFKHFNFNETYINKRERALDSLGYIGTTTLSGIALTKLIGISVLSFTHSKIFRIYYFKMWAGLVVIASVHALVVVPLLLSMIGDNKVFGHSNWSKIATN